MASRGGHACDGMDGRASSRAGTFANTATNAGTGTRSICHRDTGSAIHGGLCCTVDNATTWANAVTRTIFYSGSRAVTFNGTASNAVTGTRSIFLSSDTSSAIYGGFCSTGANATAWDDAVTRSIFPRHTSSAIHGGFGNWGAARPTVCSP